MPEIPFRYEPMAEKIMLRERRGRPFSIVVAAEGAMEQGGSVVVKRTGDVYSGTVLGGVAEIVARELALRTGKETRSIVLGHLQRGGEPTTHDRLLALRFGAAAVRFLCEGERSGVVALLGNRVGLVSLEVATDGIKVVPVDSETVTTAREMGVCFGDEGPARFLASAA